MRPPLADHPIFGRSLDELEADPADAGPFASGHTAWLHRIRRVPLWALDDDDIALLLSRGRGGLPVLLLALHRLDEDPLRRTTMPPGPLLLVVAAVEDARWRDAARGACETMLRVIAAADGQTADPLVRDELALAAERFAEMLDSKGGSPP
ncbi:MAG: contact-dependent growth inhibition system immunity protein [Gemmatimonadaceae bacterium]|nr:contact-dependent growth inhibition system immunity protein [Gemmatimonadaceae bacterium]